MEVLGGRLPKRVRLEAFSDDGEQISLLWAMGTYWSWSIYFDGREGEAGFGRENFPMEGGDNGWLELQVESCSTGLPPDLEVGLSMNMEMRNGDEWSLLDILRVPGVKPGRGFVLPVIRHTRSNKRTVHRKTAVSIVNPSHDESAKVTLTEDYEGEVCQAELTIPPRNRVIKHLDEFTASCEFKNDAKLTSDIPIAVGVLEAILPHYKLVAWPPQPIPEEQEPAE